MKHIIIKNIIRQPNNLKRLGLKSKTTYNFPIIKKNISEEISYDPITKTKPKWFKNDPTYPPLL